MATTVIKVITSVGTAGLVADAAYAWAERRTAVLDTGGNATAVDDSCAPTLFGLVPTPWDDALRVSCLVLGALGALGALLEVLCPTRTSGSAPRRAGALVAARTSSK